MNFEKQFDLLIDRMFCSQIATLESLQGCTSHEIEMLEDEYEIVLPHTYKVFLTRMGHARGNLGTYLDFSYDDALLLTKRERALWDRLESEQASIGSEYLRPDFPDDGLIFCVMYGLPEYWLIRCDGGDDSPVLRFDYENEPVEFTQTNDSFLDFLTTIVADDEASLRSAR